MYRTYNPEKFSIEDPSFGGYMLVNSRGGLYRRSTNLYYIISNCFELLKKTTTYTEADFGILEFVLLKLLYLYM